MHMFYYTVHNTRLILEWSGLFIIVEPVIEITIVYITSMVQQRDQTDGVMQTGNPYKLPSTFHVEALFKSG